MGSGAQDTVYQYTGWNAGRFLDRAAEKPQITQMNADFGRASRPAAGAAAPHDLMAVFEAAGVPPAGNRVLKLKQARCTIPV